jgi:hypothetical protein
LLRGCCSKSYISLVQEGYVISRSQIAASSVGSRSLCTIVESGGFDVPDVPTSYYNKYITYVLRTYIHT